METHLYFAFREALLIFVLICVSAVMAVMKGYAVRYWVLAALPLGLVVMAILPNANGPHLTRERRQQVRARGDRIGLVLSCIGLVLLIGRIAFHSGTGAEQDRRINAPPSRREALPTPTFPGSTSGSRAYSADRIA